MRVQGMPLQTDVVVTNSTEHTAIHHLRLPNSLVRTSIPSGLLPSQVKVHGIVHVFVFL